MNVFLSILKNDLRILTKDVKAVLLLLAMPILIIQVFAWALAPFLEKSQFVDDFKVALVDKDKTVWTALLATQLKNLDLMQDITMAESEEQAKEMIARNEIAAALIIPQNLSTSTDNWEPMEGKILGNTSMYLESRLLKDIALVGANAVSAGLASLNAIRDYETEAGLDGDTIYAHLTKANEDFIEIIMGRKEIFDVQNRDKVAIAPLEYYAGSLLSIFIMFTAIPSIKLITEERRLGILSRINAAPARGWQIILSKLLVSVLLSVVQFGIIAGFLGLATGGGLQISGLNMVLVFLCTTLASASFALLISSFATSAATANLLANMSILLMAVLGGSIYPLSSLPEASVAASTVTVNRWSAQGFLSVLTGENGSKFVESCAMLILLSAVYTLIALIVLKVRRRQVAG